MSLHSLSDPDLLSRIQKLVHREREIALQVLVHLNEIERRRLHLKLGFKSLFAYCTAGLGYSESAAMRRIKTARCVARYPQVFALLEKNEVTLSAIAQVSPVLTEENHEVLLSEIRGKSRSEVEAILAALQPGAMPRDRIRMIAVSVPAAPSLTLASPAGACERSAYRPSGGKNVATPEAPPAAADVPAKEAETIVQRVVLQFSVHPEFMAKLQKIKSLAWHRLPAKASLEQVFEFLMDLMIEKEDPAKRIERREKRKQAPAKNASDNPRHIPARVRDRVFQRDKGRCTYGGEPDEDATPLWHYNSIM